MSKETSLVKAVNKNVRTSPRKLALVCNFIKGKKLEKECKMHPMTRPKMPSTHDLQNKGRRFPPNYLHESWRDFLYWDIELEP